MNTYRGSHNTLKYKKNCVGYRRRREYRELKEIAADIDIEGYGRIFHHSTSVRIEKRKTNDNNRLSEKLREKLNV